MPSRLLCLLSVLFAASLSVAGPSVTYTIGMSRPTTHLFEIEMCVDGLPPGEAELDLVLPVWRSGRYVIFDFAGGVERFSATDQKGNPVAWRKVHKSTWRINVFGKGAVVARYLVYANEPATRTRVLDDLHGFFDPTSICMMAAKYRTAPVRVVVHPYEAWHVTTAMDPVADRANEFTASDYDTFADSPFEVGIQRDYPFTVNGIPHVLSMTGKTNLQPDSVVAIAKKIVEINAAYWGGLPYQRYVFFLRAIPDAGGGTEHLNSCVLDVEQSVSVTPDPGRNVMGLIAHEFFHTWNVKRLRPKGMAPYDWTKENYYRELWLAEGGTSYMDNLLVVRAGMSPVSGYLKGLAYQIKGDRQRPGNLEQSLTECSFDAWIKNSRWSGASWNFETDIYGRGSQVSLLLDLCMRHATGNNATFDDLLRLLYRRFPIASGGYTVDDVEAAAVELAGESMKEFFRQFVYGTESLPWETILSYAGLQVRATTDTLHAWAGINQGNDGGDRAVVNMIVAGSPAEKAGLESGDEIIALNGWKVTSAEFVHRIAERKPGEQIRCAVFRRNELREIEMTLTGDPVASYQVVKMDQPDSLQKTIYESWLGKAWDAAD